jgi:hypothetical protein
VLAQIAGMIKPDCLEICILRRDFRQGGLGQDGVGHVLDRIFHDFVNERDIPVFAGGDARDDLAPCDLRVDDRLAAPPTVVDHHDVVLHGTILPRPVIGDAAEYFRKSEFCQSRFP